MIRAGGFGNKGGTILDDEPIGSFLDALNEGIHLLIQIKSCRLFAVHRYQNGRRGVLGCQKLLTEKKKQGGQEKAACQK